jgi:hypothetical protein|eukprot:COSAG02_NODE_6318_length_3652_cov_4.042218_2_plen_41_part_00
MIEQRAPARTLMRHDDTHTQLGEMQMFNSQLYLWLSVHIT